MTPSAHVNVRIDLARVRANVSAVRAKTGKPVIAVVKADAYGLGGERIARAVADLVESFYVFDLAEVDAYRLTDTKRPTIALLGESNDAQDYLSRNVRPVVWTIERATALRAARPILSVDTGQQRFGARPEDVTEVKRAGGCDEAMTHASTLPQAQLLYDLLAHRAKLHAAGTALLDEPAAWFDAVRPGYALYRGAVRVSSPLVEARDTRGPTGYSGFVSPTGRHGVILAGYSNGLRPGPCLINGVRRSVLEVGMQSAFVELGAGDKIGDEVVLLGESISEEDVAAAWSGQPPKRPFAARFPRPTQLFVAPPFRALRPRGGTPYAVCVGGESAFPMESIPESIRFARHQVRGCLHGMKLCVAALETELPLEEAQEFLDHIEHAAAKMPQLLDDLDAIGPSHPA
jgi:alanine racemase